VFSGRKEVWFTGFARVNLCKGFRTNSFTRLTVIKKGYRGQVCVLLINLGEEDFTIRRRDRIAQGIIAAAPQWTLVEVDDLDSTDRGAGGFGSTGV
jgi:deoxyuridine 5'-triphosphate nucleotidohydrolase